MDKENKYSFGWTDYGANYGRPDVEWKMIDPDPFFKFKMVLAYIGLAIGLSMAVAPMAWVQLFMWIFK